MHKMHKTDSVPTEGRGQALAFFRKISSFSDPSDVSKPATSPGVRFSAPGVHFSAPGTTILRKFHRNKLPSKDGPSKSILRTSSHFLSGGRAAGQGPAALHSLPGPSTSHYLLAPLASAEIISDARSNDLPPPPDTLVASVEPVTADLRTQSAPLPSNGEEPLVPLMRSCDAWALMGRRFQKAAFVSTRRLKWEAPPVNTVVADRRAVAWETVRAIVRQHRGD